jgi:O-methyltransferase
MTNNLVRWMLSKEPFIDSDRYIQAGMFKKFLKWQNSYTTSTSKYFSDRFKLYDYLLDGVLNDQAIDYLEFGVFKGESLNHWVESNNVSNSRFFGFDSFEGLPEDWQTMPKGYFSTDGIVPDIKDDRVSFVKGWFQDSLPTFLKSHESKNRLVIHLDADLYSSTLFSLATLNTIIQPGTIIIFDEFLNIIHEYKALIDYEQSFLRKYKLLAYTDGYFRVAIEVIQ